MDAPLKLNFSSFWHFGAVKFYSFLLVKNGWLVRVLVITCCNFEKNAIASSQHNKFGKMPGIGSSEKRYVQSLNVENSKYEFLNAF